MLNIHPSRRADLLTPQLLDFSPVVEAWDYTDSFGNVATRITAPAGPLTVSTQFEIYDIPACPTLSPSTPPSTTSATSPTTPSPSSSAAATAKDSELEDVAW